MGSASHLFEVFSRYPRKTLRDVNPEPEDVGSAARIDASLCAKPLVNLTDADLLDYYYLAVRHVGTVEDLKHYLPRILELMATARKPLLTVKILPSVLKDAQFGSWPEAERNAVLDFCRSAPTESRLPKAVSRLAAV